MFKREFLRVLLVMFVLFSTALAHAQPVLGWLEKVYVYSDSEQIALLAKIDSGADHSSLHATDIEFYTKQNLDWVRFKTVNSSLIERPLYRYAQIKTKQGGVQQRAVISLDICIDGQKRTVETNLVNRSHYTRPFLIGRSALSGMLINPSKTDLASQIECEKPE